MVTSPLRSRAARGARLRQAAERCSRPALLAASLGLTALPAVALAQLTAVEQFRDVERQAHHLRAVLPDADSYRFVDAAFPHFRGYAGDTLVGLAFFTHELDPPIRGYKDRFWILAGLTPGGVLTGISIDYHVEPFGYFSIDLPAFAAQFPGKSILEPLEVGRDIDAVSKATITVESATRSIRQGARQLMRQFLAEEPE